MMLSINIDTVVLGQEGMHLISRVLVSKIIIILDNIYKSNCTVIVTLANLCRKTHTSIWSHLVHWLNYFLWPNKLIVLICFYLMWSSVLLLSISIVSAFKSKQILCKETTFQLLRSYASLQIYGWETFLCIAERYFLE